MWCICKHKGCFIQIVRQGSFTGQPYITHKDRKVSVNEILVKNTKTRTLRKLMLITQQYFERAEYYISSQALCPELVFFSILLCQSYSFPSQPIMTRLWPSCGSQTSLRCSRSASQAWPETTLSGDIINTRHFSSFFFFFECHQFHLNLIVGSLEYHRGYLLNWEPFLLHC